MSTPATRETNPVRGTPGQDALPRAQAKVLLVDDKPARLLTYEAMLAGLGVRCVRALSGREALEKLLLEEFAVIVLDVNMPEIDGFELAAMIREHPRLERTPIIFVTGVNVTELDQLKGYEVGAIDYISVPVIPEILRSKVVLLVELHQRRSELQTLNKALQEARAQLEKEHANVVADKDAQLQAAFEHPLQMTVVMQAQRDASGRVTDWIYTNANANALKLFGLDRAGMIGRTLEHVLGERAERAKDLCERVLESQTPLNYENRFNGADLMITVFPGGRDMVISSCIDITERKRAESALRESEQALRESQETLLIAKRAAKFGVYDWSIATGAIKWDEHVYELWGIEPGTPVSYQDFVSALHPDDVRAAQESIDRALDPQSGCVFLTDYRVVSRRDGVTRWVQAMGHVFFENGRAVRLVGTVQDVSEQRFLQESLKLADRRKDEFLAMLAHELRNPVAPIRNAAEVLSRLLKQQDQPKSLVSMIQRQGAHLSRILDDLLDVARITQGRIELKRETVSLTVSIELAIEALQPQIQLKRHQLTITKNAGPLLVHADKVRIEQCITNLVSNATKYTDVGGEIRVRSFAEGTDAVIEVADTGVGISADFVPHVFDLFAQSERSLDRSQGGLGIGLSICKRLIEMHGGTIRCYSEGAGRGSKFVLRLPLADDAPHAKPPTARASPTLERILIVDDNADAADSLSMYLQLEGHETRAVYSAEAALTELVQFAPHIVLLDIGLPRMDGYDVAKRMRTSHPELRLIALTGYGQQEDRQRTSAAGFDAHLTKPVDLGSLVDTIVATRRA